jgi:hypothetical protein
MTLSYAMARRFLTFCATTHLPCPAAPLVPEQVATLREVLAARPGHISAARWERECRAVLRMARGQETAAT